MEEKGASYFRDLLSKNVNELLRLCEEWEKTDSCPPEHVLGDIRSTIGLAKLLMRQKLSQFESLIDDSEFNRGEKEITCTDLQGFWDMVYFEVEKIIKKFKDLEHCKNNNWEIVEYQNEKLQIKKKLPVIPKTYTSAKSHALAARERIAEAKRKMKMNFSEKKGTGFIVEIRETSSEKLNEGKENHIFMTPEKVGSSHHNMQNINKSNSVSKCKEIENLPENVLIANEKSEDDKEQVDYQADTVQNKENIKHLTEKDTKTVKSAPKMNIKSKLPRPTANGKKTVRCKESIPLQCVTRSAKKVLLEQQSHLRKA